MDKNITSLFNEAIDLELNVANLYMFFYNKFPEDSDFWWKIMLEEKNHASLLKVGKEMLLSSIKSIPIEFSPPSIDQLIEANNKITSLLNEYKKRPPTRKAAFEIAIELENSAGEIHFQRSIDSDSTEIQVLDIFKKLNRDDKDHAKRILDYMHKIDAD